MRKNRVTDEYIYCYKCGTKNNSKDKKCCNRECRTKLHDKDHLYWDYLVEKWHEFLEDLGKDSVVGALTLFFNYILYGTVLSISVITIASGFVDTIIDKVNNEEPEQIVDYINKYDSNTLINGCWYSKEADEYWIITNDQFKLNDGKKKILNYSFSKIDNKKLLTVVSDENVQTGEYEWINKDNFSFDINGKKVSYEKIACSNVPGEKVEEPPKIIPEITTTTNKKTPTTTTTKKGSLNNSMIRGCYKGETLENPKKAGEYYLVFVGNQIIWKEFYENESIMERLIIYFDDDNLDTSFKTMEDKWMKNVKSYSLQWIDRNKKFKIDKRFNESAQIYTRIKCVDVPDVDCEKNNTCWFYDTPDM